MTRPAATRPGSDAPRPTAVREAREALLRDVEELARLAAVNVARETTGRAVPKTVRCKVTGDFPALDAYAAAIRAECVAEIAALKADGERLDWLETQSCWIGVHGEFEVKAHHYAGGMYSCRPRHAIDAAMSSDAGGTHE